MEKIRIGLLIISDSSFSGERADLTTPLFERKIKNIGWELCLTAIVPDEQEKIIDILSEWADGLRVDVILTSGGTGFSPRDITPEATIKVLNRQAPGIAEFLRAEGLKTTPFSTLSRGVAGIRKTSLIINLPGNPQAAVDGLDLLCPVLPHAVQLMQNIKADHSS